MLIRVELSENFSFISALFRLFSIQNFIHVLSTARMVLVSRPIRVKFMSYFPVFLLLLSFLNKGVLKELRPGEPLAGRLVKETLEEGLELWGHVIGEFDRILNNQMNKRIYAVCVEGRGSNEELINDDSKRP